MNLKEKVLDKVINSQKMQKLFSQYSTSTAQTEETPTNIPSACTVAKNAKNYCFHTWDKEVDISNFIKIPVVSDVQKDKEIIQKIKNAYFSNESVFEKSSNLDVWQLCVVPAHESLISALKNNEDEKAIEFLNNMSKNETGTGLIHYISDMDENLVDYPQLKANFKLYYMDVLINFAEWLGVIPIENAEQYVAPQQAIFGNSLGLDPDEIISLIDKKLGKKVIFPQLQSGLHAIKTNRGYFIDVHFIYMYIALRIKEILKDVPNPRICEIGGGFGFLPYYLDWVGIKDVTIVDLPSVSIISSYFLMKNLPNREILFNNSPDKYSNPEAIKLLTPEYFHNAPDNQFDLVINSRSMPEINRDIVLEYLTSMKRVSKMFYSLNQEARGVMWGFSDLNDAQKQNCVPELVEEVGGFERQSRNLLWIQKGHVEELYKIK